MTANSTRSRKNKGQRLQKEIVQTLRKKFGFDSKEQLNDFEGNITANPMGMAGIDIRLSPLAQETIPFDIESKNQEKLNIWSAIQQAEDNSKEGRIPLLVFSRNRSKTYAVLEFDKLLELLGGVNEKTE